MACCNWIVLGEVVNEFKNLMHDIGSLCPVQNDSLAILPKQINMTAPMATIMSMQPMKTKGALRPIRSNS